MTKTLLAGLALLLYTSSFAAGLDPISQAEDLRDPQAPALRAGLASQDAALRARVARAFGRIQDASSLAALYTLSQDGSAAVRAEAATALGQFGWQPQFAQGKEDEIVQRLAPLLSDSDLQVRVAAVVALGKVALTKTPELIASKLEDPAPELRAETALALYRYRLVLRLRDPSLQVADLSDTVMNSLLKLVTDSEPSVRRMVAYFFARVKDQRGLQAAITLSGDSDFWTRYYAFGALAKQGHPSGARAALDGLSRAKAIGKGTADEPTYVSVVAAINALAVLGAADQLPEDYATAPVAHIRAATARALGTIAAGASPESDATTTRLRTLLKDVSPMVQVDALHALAARLGAKAEAELRSGLSDPNWTLRQAAVESLGALGSTGEALLLQSAQDADVRVRSSVISALGAVATPEAFAKIRAALSSPRLSERGSAVDALSERVESEIPDLAYATYLDSVSDEKWTELRESLVALVAKTVNPQTTANLRLMATDPASSVAAAAQEALKARGITDLPALPKSQLSFSPYRDLEIPENPVVVLETTKGRIEITCKRDEARIHVANFVGFARDGHYDGLPWHRVVPNFVVQGGDPDGTGWGSAGWSLRAEINTQPFTRGALGMPRSQGFDTGGVQLFLNHVPTPHLDGQYTVFGYVTSGLEVIDALEVGDLILKASVK